MFRASQFSRSFAPFTDLERKRAHDASENAIRAVPHAAIMTAVTATIKTQSLRTGLVRARHRLQVLARPAEFVVTDRAIDAALLAAMLAHNFATRRAR